MALSGLGEIILGIINDLIRAYRAHQIQIPGAANTGHFGSKRLGDLHCKRADTTRSAIDQNYLLCLNPATIAQSM